MKMKLYFALLLLLLFHTACSNDSKAAPAREETTLEPGIYQPEHPEQFKLAAIESRDLPVVLNANGTVTPDVNRTIHVTSLGSGRVVDLRARLGDQVKKGQVLLMISSPDLGAAMGDFQKAQADETLSRKALERAQLLSSRGALAEKDLQLAQDAEDKARIDLQTAAQRVHLLGGDPQHPSSLIELHAPVAGTIVEQNVAGFEGIKSPDNTPSLFTIADLSQVWVLCDVYENDLGEVHVGDSAEIRLNAYPGRIFQGHIADISRVLDPSTRSAKVRIVLPNGNGLLRPGMFAAATFRSRYSQPRLVLPATAVMRLQDKDWIFRKEGNRFHRLEVQPLGEMEGGMVQIEGAANAGSLNAGDQVVAAALAFSTEMAGQGK